MCVCMPCADFFLLPSGSDQAGALVCYDSTPEGALLGFTVLLRTRGTKDGTRGRARLVPLGCASRSSERGWTRRRFVFVDRFFVFEFRRLRGSERSACSREAPCAPSPWRGPCGGKGPSGDPGLRHGALASCSLVVGHTAPVVLAAVFLRVLLRRGHAACCFRRASGDVTPRAADDCRRGTGSHDTAAHGSTTLALRVPASDVHPTTFLVWAVIKSPGANECP